MDIKGLAAKLCADYVLPYIKKNCKIADFKYRKIGL